jgi:hypothetical protein
MRIFSFLSFLIGAVAFVYAGMQFQQASEFDPLFGSFSYLFYFGSAIFFIGGFAFLYGFRGTKISDTEKKRLKASGIVTEATVSHLNHKTQIRVNGRSPYIIEADGVHPLTGTPQKFSSEWIWTDPHIELQNHKTVQIYIDPADPKKYYMDLSFLAS